MGDTTMIRIMAIAALTLFAFNVHAAKGGNKPGGGDLEADVAQLKVDVVELGAADTAIESDVAQLQSDVATAQTDLSSVQVDVYNAQSDSWRGALTAGNRGSSAPTDRTPSNARSA